jgi:ribosome-binding protein aMBF1 (putative translation factor)
MTKVKELDKTWSKDPAYRIPHEGLAPDFELASAVSRVRLRAGLTQEQLAERMETSQSATARLESGCGRPSPRGLGLVSNPTGTRLKISFEIHEARS